MLGDGWMHAGGNADELARMMAVIDERRAEHGRADLPFEVGRVTGEALLLQKLTHTDIAIESI